MAVVSSSLPLVRTIHSPHLGTLLSHGLKRRNHFPVNEAVESGQGEDMAFSFLALQVVFYLLIYLEFRETVSQFLPKMQPLQ